MTCAPDILVLAGGLGTRLRAAVPDAPKPMAPVGGRPFLEYLLDWWIGQGAGGFTLSVGYMAGCVKAHFGGRYRGVPVRYAEETEPLGTGGALALALAEGAVTTPSFVLLNGDTLFEASLAHMRREAARPGRPVVMAVKPHVAVGGGGARYGGVVVDGQGMVSAFSASPSAAPGDAGAAGDAGDGAPGFVNAGCYLMDREAVAGEMVGFPQKFSLESAFLPSLAQRGLLGASVQDGAFIDIGVPEDYRHFCACRKGR